jgi:hypothetical protein
MIRYADFQKGYPYALVSRNSISMVRLEREAQGRVYIESEGQILTFDQTGKIMSRNPFDARRLCPVTPELTARYETQCALARAQQEIFILRERLYSYDLPALRDVVNALEALNVLPVRSDDERVPAHWEITDHARQVPELPLSNKGQGDQVAPR